MNAGIPDIRDLIEKIRRCTHEKEYNCPYQGEWTQITYDTEECLDLLQPLYDELKRRQDIIDEFIHTENNGEELRWPS